MSRAARTLLLAALCTGCSAPAYRAHADFRARMASLGAVGIVTPLVTVYTEQVGFPYGVPTQELVPQAEASRAMNAAIRDALVAAGAERHRPVVPLEPQDAAGRRELEDLLDLFAVVDRSITRHVYGDFSEGFPAKEQRFEYSLGAAAACMDAPRVDAAWLITGFVLVPTTGAQVRDVVEVLLAIASAAGGGPGATTVLPKFELRAALVARDGTVLWYVRLGDGAGAADDAAEPREAGIGRRCAERLFAELDEAAR